MTGKTYAQVLKGRLTWLAVFLVLLWVVQVVNWAMGYRLNGAFALIPRESHGLDGILAMPLLHGSFEHLLANSVPLIAMGVLLATTATRALVAVNTMIVVLGGALVWLFGGAAIHVGASGLVFGWFGFLVARGLVDRSLLTLGVALGVGLFYGSILWGVLPVQEGVSWEAHLFGAVAGVVAALVIRTHVYVPRVR